MDRREFLAGALAAVSAPSHASEPLSASGAALADDIRLLRRACETLHPGLYRYLSTAAASGMFDALEQRFAARPTLAEAFLAMSAALARIRCGHTYANFYNQADRVAESLFAGATRVPFHFRWIEGRMIVLRNFSGDPRVAPGTEISAIDGVRTKSLLKTLMPLVRADGGNDAKRRSLLSVAGVEGYETFDIFHGLAFSPGSVISLRTRSQGGRTGALEVGAIDLAARRAQRTDSPSEARDELGWRLDWPRARVALLTMPSWAVYNKKADWAAYLDGVFSEIADRRATGLIIDIRANEGGLDCGDPILARLIDEDLRPEVVDRLIRYVTTPKDLDPYLDTWDDSFRDRTGTVERFDDRFFRLKNETDRAISPKGPKFSGKVALLVSPTNSSATFNFAALVQKRRLGVLIGEPTGGNQRGINGGSFFFLRLPASGLEADLPLVGSFPREERPDAGLDPDIFAPLTPDAIRAGRDPALEAAIAYANN